MRYVISGAIDFVAIYGAARVTYESCGLWWSLAAAALVALYGSYCYLQGTCSGPQHSMNSPTAAKPH